MSISKPSWKKATGYVNTSLKKDIVSDPVPCLVSSESPSQKASSWSETKTKYQTLEVTTSENITKITLNRPEKKNAISSMMCKEIIQALRDAREDESAITVITGKGDYYSSGTDLNNLMEHTDENVEELREILHHFLNVLIDFPKPLIAMVNGPAFGISVTVLGLFDIVYATDWATFQTPFVQLGLSPEGCSSYTFPMIMGPAKANEMLIFGKTLTAAEACERGLVTEVFPDSTFQKEAWTRLRDYAKLPKNPLALSKQLIRATQKEKLLAASTQEHDQILKLWLSEEFNNAMTSFLKKKSKL